MARTQQKVKVVTTDKAMAGILALLVADREERLGDGDDEPQKTEVILAGAGLDAPEIAGLVSKQVPTVQKAIERARKKGTSRRGRTARG